jgi:hypothetical protein
MLLTTNLKLVLLIVLIFFVSLVILILLFFTILEYKFYKYKTYVVVFCFLFRKLNSQKIKVHKNNCSFSKFVVEKINDTNEIKCEICYEIFDDEKKDKFFKFSCCKYKNIMCENCTLTHYKIKNKFFSLFGSVNCPFCTQKIYVGNFDTNTILKLSQKYLPNELNA